MRRNGRDSHLPIEASLHNRELSDLFTEEIDELRL